MPPMSQSKAAEVPGIEYEETVWSDGDAGSATVGPAGARWRVRREPESRVVGAGSATGERRVREGSPPTGEFLVARLTVSGDPCTWICPWVPAWSAVSASPLVA